MVLRAGFREDDFVEVTEKWLPSDLGNPRTPAQAPRGHNGGTWPRDPLRNSENHYDLSRSSDHIQGTSVLVRSARAQDPAYRPTPVTACNLIELSDEDTRINHHRSIMGFLFGSSWQQVATSFWPPGGGYTDWLRWSTVAGCCTGLLTGLFVLDREWRQDESAASRESRGAVCCRRDP